MAVLSYDKRSVREWIIEERAQQTKRTIVYRETGEYELETEKQNK